MRVNSAPCSSSLCSKVDYIVLIFNRAVYSGKDGSVQRLFIQRWGVVAVFIAIVHSADAAPDDALAAVAVAPCAALISCTALTAIQPIRQRIFAAVPAPTGRGIFL